MDKEQLNSLLHTNAELEPAQLGDLSAVLEEYPYFQAVRALQLKGFYQTHSLTYNAALKKTAAYTTDRSVLFEYITSDEFLQDRISGQIAKRHRTMKEEEQKATEWTEVLKMNVQEAEQVLDPLLFEEAKKSGLEVQSDKLHKDREADATAVAKLFEEKEKEKAESSRLIEKTEVPIKFNKSQEHSFSDWLKLMKAKPIQRTEDEAPKTTKISREHEIIDKFIEESPRIMPSEKAISQISIKDYEPDNQLMTETLAKIYADQRNFDKAIQAYKILMLKNPEKSGLFADRIREIEKIKENKNK